MAGYLIAEEGPLTGLIVRMEEGTEWILGRDPDSATVVLEDPMVSRKHVICSSTSEGYLLENLSSVNPVTQNGKVVAEPILLKEGDIIQIGSTFFRFTEKTPVEETPEELKTPEIFEEVGEVPTGISEETRWMMKVISGPNAGAEFSLQKGETLVIGKDPDTCDILFQDLSVSRQHAKMTIDEQNHLFIEDLHSKNGVLVNAQQITERSELDSQDLIAMGTTSFLVIDREQERETLIAPPMMRYEPEAPKEAEEKAEEEAVTVKEKMRDWKNLVIPKKHLFFAGAFALCILSAIVAMLSLFHSEPLEMEEVDPTREIRRVLNSYPEVQFSYNAPTGNLFLVGHVLTSVDQMEMLHQLRTISMIMMIEDNVVIDEMVWQAMNELLNTNEAWIGVSVHSSSPGRFILTGYLENTQQYQELIDYMNVNFPFLDRLENHVIVETNLLLQIESLLLRNGFNNLGIQLTNGQLVLAGQVGSNQADRYEDLVSELKALPGVRSLLDFVVITSQVTPPANLSSDYQVTGFAEEKDGGSYALINGRIFGVGDSLDDMDIVAIDPTQVLLEKDGLKFTINYNLQ